MTARIDLKTPSGGYVILNPQDTAVDVPLTIPASGSQLAVADANGNVVSGGQTLSPQTGFKNRIINGGMVIDQRNAGASVTQTASNLYGVDRFQAFGSVTSKFTFQQSAVSPSGFINSTLVTSSAATSLGASDAYMYGQFIEGLNMADLSWGTANAQPVTLSFWVRSSLTGNFGGSIQNSDNTRNYPFVYTISAANTWEYKTITIPGDTTGTWLTTNAIGMKVRWSMGAGSTVSGAAGVWSSTLYFSVTGAVSVVGTNGATWYVTGVQLEKGSSATAFEFRSIGQELALCQRYYQNAPSTNITLYAPSTVDGNSFGWIPLLVQMRATPTFGIGSGGSGGVTVSASYVNGATVYKAGAGATYQFISSWNATAEL